MKLDFTRIPQNSRTIVFECFNAERPDLVKQSFRLNSDDPSPLEKINKNLLVHSFEEFKEKFNPVIYEYYDKDASGRPVVKYSVTKPTDKKHNSIELCKHEFYLAVRKIAEQKAASSKNNEQIDYSTVYEMLSPQHIYERSKQRKTNVMQFVYNAWEAQENGDPDTAESWLKKAQATLEDVKHEYEGSAIKFLPVAIHEAERLIMNADEKPEKDSEKPDDKSYSYDIVWDDEGNIKAIEVENPPVLQMESNNNQILKLVQQGWENTANQLPDNKVPKKLFLQIFSDVKDSSLALNSKNKDELVEYKKELSGTYIEELQSFCDSIGHLIQKVASLEQFFIHAADENERVESGVVIANCTIKDIFSDSETEKNVKRYLMDSGLQGKDKIWFAILPAAIDNEGNWKDKTRKKSGNRNIFENGFPNTSNYADEVEEKFGIKKICLSDISKMGKFLNECGILSFFNLNACEQTSFKMFNKDISAAVDMIEKDFYKESVVLAYPNFSIIPKDKRKVVFKDLGEELFTPTIYIDAAYVAAGIVVATQTEKIQKIVNKDKNIKDGLPFVRFDLEDAELGEPFYAHFNPESRNNISSEVAAELRSKKGNLFCFRSDDDEDNVFVLTARLLNGYPVYYWLTREYYMFLKDRVYNRTGLSAEQAEEYVLSIMKLAENMSAFKILNTPLLKGSGEEITFEKKNNERGEFKFTFKGMDTPLIYESKIVTESAED